jgi:hypothetical protein
MKTRPTRTPATRRALASPLIALAVFALAAPCAPAQQAPDGATASAAATDPPDRVARLNYMAGAVTTEPAGTSNWSYAQLNRPLTTGDQLWTDRNARAELHIGSTAVRMDASTSLDILNLDDRTAQLKVAQGTLSTRVRELPDGAAYEIDTPNLALALNAPGDYRVDVAPDGSSTTVTVRSGSATAYGENGQMPVAAGQQIRFAGTGLQTLADGAAPPPDAFDQWTDARDEAEDRSISARYVSRDIPGYEDLDANGTWRSTPQYGEVWVPDAVPAGWAPYHDGHWIWQAPWGWTWVDDAPWGFAPYHYGRWAFFDGTWAWVPGPLVVDAPPPVYAPALVAFVGGGGGGFDWGVSLAAGGIAAAGLAWFPLGPGEPWHPRWGDWSPRYYEGVNRTVVNVTNITNITNIHTTYVNYRVPGAVTAVPATVFMHGQPVGRFAQKVDPGHWHNVTFNPGVPRIAPVRQSFGPDLRRASVRPPVPLATRPVIATRSPAVPPAYRDTLAQRFARGGARVPGAGAPVIRTSMPAHFAATQAHGVPRDIRLVQAHSPVIEARPAPGAPHGSRPPFASQAPHGAPSGLADARPPAGHEVPHPPQAGTNGMVEHGHATPGEAAHREPAWTQPHPPMAQQAQQDERPSQPRIEGRSAAPSGPPQREARGAPEARMPEAPAQHAQASPFHQAVPTPQHADRPQPAPHAEPPHEAMRPTPHAEPPREAMHSVPHAEPPREAMRPTPHAEPPREAFHPQARPAPRPAEPPRQTHAAPPAHSGDNGRDEHHPN